MSTVVTSAKPTESVEQLSLSAALGRHGDCQARYREMLGSAYEADAYAELLKATRAVMLLRGGANASGTRTAAR